MEGIDADAVARARSGDREAFRELVERHSRRIFGLAYRMTGNEEDAEDVVQETFLRAYRSLPRFEGKSEFATWIHRIAANCAVDLLRRRPQQSDGRTRGREDSGRDSPLAVPDPGSGADPDRHLAAGEFRRRFAACLAALTPLERAAFVLRHLEGKPVAEIARSLGVRAGSARQSVFRAVTKLRRELAAIGPGLP